MKKFLALVVLLIAFCFSRTGVANDMAKASGDVDFKALMQHYYDDWTVSPKKAAKYYDKSPDRVIFDVAPFQYKGWSEYQEGAQKNFFDLVTSLKFVVNDDLKIERKGDMAFTTVTFRLVGNLKAGGTMDVACRQTDVWEKINGQWLIVHEHISTPLAPPAPATK